MKSWPFLLAAILLVLTVGISGAEEDGKEDGQGEEETGFRAKLSKGWKAVKQKTKSLWGQFKALVTPAIKAATEAAKESIKQGISKLANEEKEEPEKTE